MATPAGAPSRLASHAPVDLNYARTTMTIITITQHPFDLYLDSASRENVIALIRLGSLCGDNMPDEETTSRAKDLVCRLRPNFQLAKVLGQIEYDDDPMRFWFEGAVHRNPLA
jgi:hypothetical protein